MANLVLLTLAFAALVAFASAHTTIITTTIDDENPTSHQQECRQRLHGQEFKNCESYLQQGQTSDEENKHKQDLQQCCKELENVDEQCQCEAVKKVFREVLTEQQRHPGHQGVEYGLKEKAQSLTKQCKLHTKRCEIGTIMTTTTTITEGNPFWPLGSKQCSKREVQGRVNKCQRYVEEQIFSSPRTLVMSINKQKQHEHEQQGLQECCNELQNMRKDCQCEAMKEVMRQTKQHQHQRGEYGKQEEQMQVAWHVVENLPNKCRLDVQQCHIPHEMS